MVELSKDQYQCVKTLLPPTNKGYIEPRAVVELNNPGWVFVNSESNPKVALIWSQGNKGFYLLGRQIVSYAENINNFLDAYISPKLLSKGIEYFEISSVPPVTDGELHNIFKARKLNSWEQSVYVYRENHMIPEAFLREGCLCDIKDIGKKYMVNNMEFVNSKILDYWDSLDAFHAKADGVCLLIDNMVASLALTGWITENTHEISIETVESYRRKGFAKICATALVNYYLKQGHLPYWECEMNNIASAKLAESLGFSKLHNYTCYGFGISD